MKTLKTILSVFALAAVFSASTFAQGGGAQSAVVNATANVNSALSISFSTTTLAFGGLSQGNYTAIVSANSAHNGGNNSDTGSGASTAIGEIEGTAGASIDVSYNSSVVMENGNGDQLTVTPVIYLTNDATPATELIAQTGTSTSIDSDGKSDLTVGGEITIATTTPTGSYDTATGAGTDLTVTVNYN